MKKCWIFSCPNHAKKKLERCSEAEVCTDCIIKSNNGDSVKSLSEVYKELEDCSKRRKEEIEKSLLPKYRNLLAKEKKSGQRLLREPTKYRRKLMCIRRE